jgi:hypothetical protein
LSKKAKKSSLLHYEEGRYVRIGSFIDSLSLPDNFEIPPDNAKLNTLWLSIFPTSPSPADILAVSEYPGDESVLFRILQGNEEGFFPLLESYHFAWVSARINGLYRIIREKKVLMITCSWCVFSFLV